GQQPQQPGRDLAVASRDDDVHGEGRLSGPGAAPPGAPAAPQPLHPLELAGVEARDEAQEADHRLELGRGEALELAVRRLDQRPEDLPRAPPRPLGHLDQHPAAVRRVAAAPHVAASLEAVERRRHRRRAQVGELGEPPRRRRALPVDEVEHAGVGAVDAEEGGNLVVEDVLLDLPAPDGLTELALQVLLGASRHLEALFAITLRGSKDSSVEGSLPGRTANWLTRSKPASCERRTPAPPSPSTG